MGLGEEYMAGNIDVEGDFKELMLLRTLPAFQNLKLSFGTKLGMLFPYPTTLNPLMQSPKNISYHDDRGNDFCRLCLEQSMTYSCAYFRGENDTLEQAQPQKYEHICRKLQLQPATFWSISAAAGATISLTNLIRWVRFYSASSQSPPTPTALFASTIARSLL